ncbi:MAG: hypothetical protein AAGH99_04785 [Planctomycetota bacterium]
MPELGGKVSSIVDRRNGYEWLWAADRSRPWFTNRPGDAFEDSTMAGIDECIPTVAACEVDGKKLADHGEVWSKPWSVDTEDDTSLTLSVELCGGTLCFSRRVAVEGDTVVLDYTLRNLTGEEVPVLWCVHPLFTITPQTRLRVTPSALGTGYVEMASGLPIDGGQSIGFPELSPGVIPGVSFADASFPEGMCTKLFYPLEKPWGQTVEAEIEEPGVGRLTMAFESSDWLNTLGIWLDRGGWQGYQHLAIEPTNAPYGRLSDATAQAPREAAFLQARQEKRWQLRLRVENGQSS